MSVPLKRSDPVLSHDGWLPGDGSGCKGFGVGDRGPGIGSDGLGVGSVGPGLGSVGGTGIGFGASTCSVPTFDTYTR